MSFSCQCPDCKPFFVSSWTKLGDMAAKPVAPTHRHRSKSAPRGKSPDPKALKKAAKEAKKGKENKDQAPGSLVTPPPKVRNSSPERSAPQKEPAQRRLTWGTNSVHDIVAEGGKGMDEREANEILKNMKDQ